MSSRLPLPSWVSIALSSVVGLAACGDGGESSTTGGGPACDLGALAKFAPGDPNGAADVFGAKAAGQARAGRIKAADVAQPAHGRQRIKDGDFVLANDKIAAVVEDARLSDGYSPYGGGIIALDQIGDDGRMRGLSNFVESMPGFSIFVIDPRDVSVMNDGLDGQAAVVRVTGKLAVVPFLAVSFGGLFPADYDGKEAAYEYVLEPGAEKVRVRLGIVNDSDVDLDVGIAKNSSDEFFGFIHGNHNQRVTAENGFDKPTGQVDFAGFVSAGAPFAYQALRPEKLEYGGLDLSGFQLFVGQGFLAKACSQTLLDRHDIVVGGPEYDGLREAIRRADGDAPWHAITGKVVDSTGAPLADAWVHAVDAGGKYLSRTKSGADGSYAIHVPDGGATIIPEKRGYPTNAGKTVGGADATVDLQFAPNGFVHVVATDQDTGAALPVRIHVLPTTPPAATPATFGVDDESDGKLWQEFSVSGDATLAVPPGDMRIVVSHGPEWEIVDTNVTVAAGATVEVPAPLLHSVDSTGVLCADFHIHAAQSIDSTDPVEYKVRGILADGLELPTSSEHDWVADFEPYIQSFGATKWARSIPSEELSTYGWGHFGVIPSTPKIDQWNMGAIDWINHSPAEVFGAVHALPDAPILIVNHPESTNMGYFTAVGFDKTLGKGTNDLWDPSFEAIEVFNASDLEENRDKSVADWFSMLSNGTNVWAVGSSDCHFLRSCATGYPRTCLRLGSDDPNAVTDGEVRDAAGSGRSTVSGGLFMTVDGPNGSGPGDLLPKAQSATFTITIEAPSWVGMANPTLETFVNGSSAKVEPLLPVGTGPSKKFMNVVDVALDPGKRSWVVFHAKADGDLSPVLPGRRPFAVSNPIIFD